MKSLIFVSILVSSLFAQARSIMPIDALPTISADLEVFEVNHELLSGANFGSVSVNAVDGEVTLTLIEKFVCPAGQYCIQIALSPIVTKIVLPLVETYVDTCGSTIYVAKEDLRAVHGGLAELIVADHSTMTCEILLSHLSSVEYTTESATEYGQSQTITQSRFAGGEFGPLYILHVEPDYPVAQPF